MENFSLGRGTGHKISAWLLKKNPPEMEFRIIFTMRKCQSGLKIQTDFTSQS